MIRDKNYINLENEALKDNIKRLPKNKTLKSKNDMSRQKRLKRQQKRLQF